MNDVITVMVKAAGSHTYLLSVIFSWECHEGVSITSYWGLLLFSASSNVRSSKSQWESVIYSNPDLSSCEPSCLSLHYLGIALYSKTWITRTAGDHQKSLSYEKLELWFVLSLYISHVASVVSPFPSSVFHLLIELSKLCETSFSYEKKTNEVKLVTQEY